MDLTASGADCFSNKSESCANYRRLIENVDEQISLSDLGLWSGRTSAERSVPTKAATSSASSRNASESRSHPPLTCLCLTRASGQKPGFSWETDSQLLGAYSTRNIGEYPSDAVESRLFAILEDTPHPKYSLTETAAIGILRRAERRGKELPEVLRFALERQSGLRRDTFGQAKITDAGEILRALRSEIGAASFIEWIRRAAVLFQQKKILLCGVRGSGEQRGETETACQVRESEPSKSETCNPLCPVRYLRENGLYGNSPYRQKPDEQLTRKLSALVQELSRQTAPYKAFLRCLRSACEGALPVYETLASVAEKQSARLGYGLYEINQSRNAESGSSAVVCAYPAIARSLTARMDGSPCIDRGPKIIVQNGVKCLNPWDSQSGRVYDADGAFHSLVSCENAGMQRDAVLTYDARGNGDGKTVCTLTGDHENRVTDYTAVVVGGELSGTASRNQVLRVLQETYGAEAVFQWGVGVLDILQSKEILRQGVHESGISSKAEGGNELDDSALPRPEPVAEWLLRDLRDRKECGCTSQGRQPAKQQPGELATALPELPYEGTQNAQSLFDMWKAGKRLGLLRKALSEIQEIRQSICRKSESVQQYPVVRRLTPLEAERLQGYPDGYTDIGEWTDSKGKRRQTSDAARYKALGNSIALPPWKWVLKRIAAQYERDATLGSLFDGIGGFGLLWTQLNGLESVLWASEIEPFCVAVCKRHFGDSGTGEKGDLHEILFK